MPKAKALQRQRQRVQRTHRKVIIDAQVIVRNGNGYARKGKRRGHFDVREGVSDGQKFVVAHEERYTPVSNALALSFRGWKTLKSTGSKKRRLKAIIRRICAVVGIEARYFETCEIGYGKFRVIARTTAQVNALREIQEDNADILTLSEIA